MYLTSIPVIQTPVNNNAVFFIWKSEVGLTLNNCFHKINNDISTVLKLKFVIKNKVQIIPSCLTL